MIKLSTSKVKLYKGCRKLYFFKCIEKLTAVNEDTEALAMGRSYHALIEELYNNGDVELDVENEPKLAAMIMAYKKFIYPEFNCHRAEEWFEMELDDKVSLVGRFDGIADDGLVVEHKTTSSDINDEYVYNLNWDEQVLNYSLANNSNAVYYTVCKKPTLRLCKNETNESFYQRCLEWYNTDTDLKIRVIKVTRTDEEIKKQKERLIAIGHEMESLEKQNPEDYDLVFYRNPNYCQQWGRQCAFAPICLDYDPEINYVNFEKKGENNETEN